MERIEAAGPDKISVVWLTRSAATTVVFATVVGIGVVQDMDFTVTLLDTNVKPLFTDTCKVIVL